VRSSTVRTVLWAMALVVALTAVGIAFVRGDGDGTAGDVAEPAPGPTVPERPGDGCAEAAATDPADLRADRPVARCGEGAPEAVPLPAPATVRVAVTRQGASAAPLLVADALGEFAAENLTVEVVDLPVSDAYAALARGEVDGVVGGVDAPFFDGAREGSGARLVLGGTLSRRPGDTEVAQAGLWARAELWDDPDDWRPIAGQTVAVADGLDSSALYPIRLTLDQEELNLNAVETAAMGEDDAVDRLTGGQVGLAWLSGPAAASVAGDDALRLVGTLPASESIDGTVLSARLVGPDRAVGLAYVRAVIRTINTHLADGYGEDAAEALAEATDTDASDEITAGPDPLFDWELRAGTAGRIQDALAVVGSIGYEIPLEESQVVDRTLYEDAVAAQDQG
jgi:NitT/TauT family transport system substrate-binding protein